MRDTFGMDPEKMNTAELKRELKIHLKTIRSGNVGTPNVYVRQGDLEREIRKRQVKKSVWYKRWEDLSDSFRSDQSRYSVAEQLKAVYALINKIKGFRTRANANHAKEALDIFIQENLTQ